MLSVELQWLPAQITGRMVEDHGFLHEAHVRARYLARVGSARFMQLEPQAWYMALKRPYGDVWLLISSLTLPSPLREHS